MHAVSDDVCRIRSLRRQRRIRLGRQWISSYLSVLFLLPAIAGAQPTSHRESMRDEPERTAPLRTLDESFWDLTLRTTEGGEIALRDLRGRYVLLNFWGEWCPPCLTEIPVLVRLRYTQPDERLFIIGILRTDEPDAARQVVEEMGMSWPQVMMTKTLRDRFRIIGYPTNILILPGGDRYLKAYMVSEVFFDRNLK